MFLFAAGALAVALVNAGFEDVEGGKALGWKLDPTMHVERGAGVNGSAGLVWEASKPLEKRACTTQEIEVKEGQQYRFSVLIRAERIKNSKGAKICAYFLNAQGKMLHDMYTRGLRESSDWVQAVGIGEAPKGTVKMRISLDVLPAGTGRVVFDNVIVETAKREVVVYAFSSAYRNIAASGELAFHGMVHVPLGRSMEDLEAFFAWRGADGSECRRSAELRMDFGEVYAKVAARVDELAEGTQDVRFEVKAKDGETLGATSFAFSRVAELPKRRVWIDRHGRCIVNGEPFFPVGMYSHIMNDEDAGIYAAGPFNCVVVYGLSSRADIDRLAKHGIMYVPTLKNEIPGKLQAVRLGIKTQAESDAFFRGEIAKLKDAPNLLAWYVCDEAPISEIPVRSHIYALYRECDVDHPCWALHCSIPRVREYMPICDVMGADVYPVGKRANMLRMTDFSAALRAATGQGARPFWNVPQNFDWSWYGRKEGRMPTTEEMVFFNWCFIAAGANGLIGYTFSAIRQEKNRGAADFEKNWKSICAAYADVKRLVPVLLSVEETPPAPPVSNATPVRIWRKDGKLYVLACNAGTETAKIEVPLGGEQFSLDGVEIGAADLVSLDGGKLVFTLPPAGYSMARCR